VLRDVLSGTQQGTVLVQNTGPCSVVTVLVHNTGPCSVVPSPLVSSSQTLHQQRCDSSRRVLVSLSGYRVGSALMEFCLVLLGLSRQTQRALPFKSSSIHYLSVTSYFSCSQSHHLRFNHSAENGDIFN
jgi:hypothetical protein